MLINLFCYLFLLLCAISVVIRKKKTVSSRLQLAQKGLRGFGCKWLKRVARFLGFLTYKSQGEGQPQRGSFWGGRDGRKKKKRAKEKAKEEKVTTKQKGERKRKGREKEVATAKVGKKLETRSERESSWGRKTQQRIFLDNGGEEQKEGDNGRSSWGVERL